MPDLVVIGGPNGAGKTSWALKYLEPTLGIREFVNADEIARELSPENVERAAFSAGRLFVRQVAELADAGASFAIETTFAGHSHMRLLTECRTKGYRITLVFLWLPSVEHAISRVNRRVAEGGHAVPWPIIRRRYLAGLRNLRQIYLSLVDIAVIYDNSDEAPQVIAEQRPGSSIIIHDSVRWARIEDAAR